MKHPSFMLVLGTLGMLLLWGCDPAVQTANSNPPTEASDSDESETGKPKAKSSKSLEQMKAELADINETIATRQKELIELQEKATELQQEISRIEAEGKYLSIAQLLKGVPHDFQPRTTLEEKQINEWLAKNAVGKQIELVEQQFEFTKIDRPPKVEKGVEYYECWFIASEETRLFGHPLKVSLYDIKGDFRIWYPYPGAPIEILDTLERWIGKSVTVRAKVVRARCVRHSVNSLVLDVSDVQVNDIVFPNRR